MTFYERFETLCKSRGLYPQSKEIMAMAKVSSPAISGWKNEGAIPKVEVLVRIADYFGVTIDYLLGREGRMAVLEQKALDILDGNVVFNEQERELLEAFRSTTEKGRFKIIQAVMNICDEIEKKSASSDTSVTDQ